MMNQLTPFFEEVVALLLLPHGPSKCMAGYLRTYELIQLSICCKKLQGFKSLVFSICTWTDSIGDAIGAGQLPNLCFLDLKKQLLGDRGKILCFLRALRSPGMARALEYLDLSLNNLRDDGLFMLCDVLKEKRAFQNLRYLCLNSNGIGCEGAEIFAEVLQLEGVCPKLENLLLSINTISDGGALSLSAALKVAPCRLTLKALDLSTNRIGHQGVRELSQLFSTSAGPCLRLDTLRFFGNALGRDGLRAFLDTWQSPLAYRGLGSLDLGGNNIRNDGAAVLATALRTLNAFPNLTLLELGFNRITDHGAVLLAQALSHPRVCPKLCKLFLGDNSIGGEGGRALGEMLQDPSTLPNLKILTLHGNRIGDEGALAISRALEIACLELERLNLSYNSIGEEGLEAVIGSLKQPGSAPKLHSFSMNGNVAKSRRTNDLLDDLSDILNRRKVRGVI